MNFDQFKRKSIYQLFKWNNFKYFQANIESVLFIFVDFDVIFYLTCQSCLKLYISKLLS